MKPDTLLRVRAALRWLLGGLMLWAAVSKLAAPTEFLGAIYSYKLPLPQAWLQFAAVLLPWLELLCGLALIADKWTESALTLVLGLCVVFVLATGQAWLRGLDISCGCLDFKILGVVKPADGAISFFESAAFAFFRALLLVAMTGWLLRHQLSEVNTRDQTAAVS
ncbi:MAG: DoxX family membrane protein [Verrucomicrobia bacterium]|nr:DoxX family membrane protein [Verrucomicrobiota bacterium]